MSASETSPDRELDQHPRADALSGVVFVGVSVWLWTISGSFPSVPGRYVRVVLGAIVVLSSVQVLRALYRMYRDRGRPGATRAGRSAPVGGGVGELGARLPTGLAFVAGSVLYVVAIPIVGYLSSTIVFLVLSFGLQLGWRPRYQLPVVSLAVGMYLLLDRGLNVTVPSGWLL